MDSRVIVACTVAVVWIIRSILGFKRVVDSINNHPGNRIVFNLKGITSLLPRITYITGGRSIPNWRNKFKPFEEYGSDIIANVHALPTHSVIFIVADPIAAKEIFSSRQRFPKPIQNYKILRFYGGNIIASEGEEWRRYRKICSPSFSEPNNRLVWDATVSIVHDLFDSWGDKKQVECNHALELTTSLALFVLGGAAFGRRMSWALETPPEKGQLTFRDTLHRVSEGLVLKLIAPKWAVPFSMRLQEVSLGFGELERHMHEMIQDRRSSGTKSERHDLFSSLLDANDGSSEGDTNLTDGELLSNLFTFLFAGHDSTAHSLCYSLALLALYQDEQERAYREIQKAIPDDRRPTFQDLPALSYVESVMNETLRMFPPGVGVPKMSAGDTTLITNIGKQQTVIPIPAGATLMISILAIHYNPKYWKSPERFDPSRFLGDWPRDAFLPFSGGARSCIGRRFAELESIAAITTILQRYKITVKQEAQFDGETSDQRKERVLNTEQGVMLNYVNRVLRLTFLSDISCTARPVRVPLTFTRRY